MGVRTPVTPVLFLPEHEDRLAVGEVMSDVVVGKESNA